MMVFGPIVADEDHQSPPPVSLHSHEPETPGGVLMNQCSQWHDIPSALQASRQLAGAPSTRRGQPRLTSDKCSPASGLNNQRLATTTETCRQHANPLPLASDNIVSAAPSPHPDWRC